MLAINGLSSLSRSARASQPVRRRTSRCADSSATPRTTPSSHGRGAAALPPKWPGPWATMGMFGLWGCRHRHLHLMYELPNAFTMGAAGFAALVANAAFLPVMGYRRRCQHAVGVDLHAQRCARQSRRLARRAWGVRTGTGWPDISSPQQAVLALQGAAVVIRQSSVSCASQSLSREAA